MSSGSLSAAASAPSGPRGRAACPPSPARRPRCARPAAGAGTSSSPPGGTRNRPSGFAERLAILASTFVPAMPTLSGSPTSARTSRRSSAPSSAASAGVPGTCRNASSSEPGCTTSHVAVEDREHRAARLAVGLPRVVGDQQPRAQPPRPGRRHPAADAERARLVARRHDDPTPDDDRQARAATGRRAGRRRRRTRRRRRGAPYEHMFAWCAAERSPPELVAGTAQREHAHVVRDPAAPAERVGQRLGQLRRLQVAELRRPAPTSACIPSSSERSRRSTSPSV